MAKYNRSRTISSGLSKYNKVKDIKSMTAAEKLQYLYSGDEIDIKDPEGIVLLNSGMNYKEAGKEIGKIENKNLSILLKNMYDAEIFQKLAKKTTSAEEMILNAIDFNNRIDISTKQKTKTFSSISDLKTVYDNFTQLRQDGGNLFIFDTETFGGKTKSNIWTPAGITEFAMQEVNLGTGAVNNTNILMGIAPTAENRKIRDRIIDLMKAGKWKEIENDEQLAVTARRVSLYYDAKIDSSGPFAKVTQLGDTDNNPWKNLERFKKAWEKLENAYTDSAINVNGMRASDAAFFESIYKLQTGLNNKTAMALGQNFQIFDEKVINNQLQQITYNYTQMAKGTQIGLELSKSLGINQQQAQSAVSYINSMMMHMGNQGLNMPNERTLDLLPYLHVGRDYFGTSTMYNGNMEIMNKAMGGTAKQEYIGEAWFPDLFQGNNAHMADFDVTVLRYLTTQNIDKLGNKTFFDHLMTSMGTDKTGILGIDDGTKKLQQGQVFYIKNSGNQSFQGKTLLNYTYNNKTGEVFTNAGYNFVDGHSMGFNKSDITMGTNLKKGMFYRVEGIKKVKSVDIADNLGLVIPEMSGEDLFHVQFKMFLPDNLKNKGTGLDELTYNMLFTSEKELSGFFSSNAQLALNKYQHGKFSVAENAADLFDWIDTAEGVDGEKIIGRYSEIKPNVDLQQRINMTLNTAAENFMAEKAHNSVLNSDRSYKKISDMRAANKALVKQGLTDITAEELDALLDGKIIRDITQEKADFVQKKLTNILGFENWVTKGNTLYSNTRRSTTYAWDVVQSQGTFYDNVLNNLNEYAKNKKLSNEQKSFMFNDLVESFRAQAALNVFGSYTEDARRMINGTKEQAMISAYEYKNFFDFEFSDSFLKDKSKAQHIQTRHTSEKYKNVMRINIEDEGAASYKLVDEIRRRRFGFDEGTGDRDYRNRKSFVSFLDELQNSGFKGGKDFNKLVSYVTEDENFNVNVASRDFIKIIKNKKKIDPTFAYIKEIDRFSTDVDPRLGNYLNNLNDTQILDQITKKMITPVDSKQLLKTKDGMKDFVSNNLISKYMPDEGTFRKAISGFDSIQQEQKMKLYSLLKQDISAQLQDILSITTRVEGMETFISKSGDIVAYKGNNAIKLGSIPKVQMMSNGHLVGVLGNQKLNLHLDIAYDEKGGAQIVTNLGEKFRHNRTVSNNVRRKLKDGTFRFDDLYNYTNTISKDLREQATFSGTSGELLSNFFVGTKEFDKVLPSIFGYGGKNAELIEIMGLDSEFVELMRDRLPEQLEAGALDPAKQQMMGAYRLSMMRALAEKQGNYDLVDFINTMNASTKEKSKLGNDIFMGGGFRFHTGFTNTLDENSRPVIGGSGNVYYLSEDMIDSATQKFGNKMRTNSLFTSESVERLTKINNDLLGRTTTGFSGRTAYVGQEGIRIILNNNMDRILKQDWEHLTDPAEKKNVYNFLYSFLNTFEQAKVFDAEVFDQITGGTFAANVQTLSASKDIMSAIDRVGTPEQIEDLLKLRGSISIDRNSNTIKFTSDVGKIIKRGDALVPYEGFGDTAENWVSKMDKGLMRYTVRDESGRFLTDDQITDVLNKHINRFDGIDNEVAAHKIADSIFEEMGFKAAYTIEDVNKTTLPKILVNGAEKSMNQLAYMRIGTLDPRIAKVLAEYGQETKELIGEAVPTKQALRAYFNNAAKTSSVLANNGFGSLDDFINAVFNESYAANKMIFGKGGLFEGFVAIGNDNIAGHKNKGTMMTGAVNEAIAMLGKWTNGGVEDANTFNKGLELFRDIVNDPNNDFKFYKNNKGVGYNLKIKNGSLMLEHGGNLKEGLSEFDILDTQKLENLLVHINDKYLGGDNVPLADKLVHRDANGKIQYLGRMIYTQVDGKDTVFGSSGWGELRIVIDSETQSGLGRDYTKAREDLVSTKSQLKQLEKDYKKISSDIKKAEAKGIPIDDSTYDQQAKMLIKQNSMKETIDVLQGKIRDLETTGHQFRIGDRERNVLSQHTLTDVDYDFIEGRLKNQEDKLMRDHLVGSAMDGLNKEKYGHYKVYQPLQDELKKLSYYNKLDEERLTKRMLKQEKYSHLKDVYQDIVTDKGFALGVEHANQIYDLRMVEAANQFNNPDPRYKIKTVDDMIKLGFDKDIMTPEQYLNAYGDPTLPVNQKIARKNVIIDLGNDFSADKRFIAVPGMGATVGSEEIRKKWHTHASTLSKIYTEKYMTAEGNQEQLDEAIEGIDKYRKEIAKDTAEYIKKKGPLHERMQYKVQSAMDRTKIMSLPEYMENPLFQQAEIDGKSLASWRAKGVYHDAIFEDISLFRKRGFFDPDYLDKVGMTKEEMKQHLMKHGATMIDDRYPNIYDTSMTSARHYLFESKDPHSTNAAYTTQETLLKMLGDSDGDSRSGFVASYSGTTHLEYDIQRQRAVELAKQQRLTGVERENFIRKTTIDAGISGEAYDFFKGIDIHALSTAIKENEMWHRDVLGIVKEDIGKTIKAQSVIADGTSTIAELVRNVEKDHEWVGQSILGREKYTALSYDPTIHEVKQSVRDMDTILDNLRQNKKYLTHEKYNRIWETAGQSVTELDDEINVLDLALQGIEEIGKNQQTAIDVFGSEREAADRLENAQNLIRQRVRINNYHNEIMSKLGISAVGNVNAAFFGATQAAKDFFGNIDGPNYNREKSNILQAMATVIEQSSISSKKNVIRAGDGRVVSLGNILNKIAYEGYGTDDENYTQAMEWLNQYADKSKTVSEYNKLMIRTNRASNVNDVAKDDKIQYMFKRALDVYNEVWSDDQMKPMAEAHKMLGTGNASPTTLRYLRGVEDDSITSTIIQEVKRRNNIPITRKASEDAKEVMDEVMTNAFRNAREKNNLMNNIARNLSNKVMNSGAGVGTALTMTTVGLALGLMASGYASGNPLNDAQPETVAKEQTQRPPKLSFGPNAEMVPNNTGGYIINIKGDTSKGNRQLKKALKQAANNSVGGAVNINMSLRTSQSGGYSDKDIESILNDYF